MCEIIQNSQYFCLGQYLRMKLPNNIYPILYQEPYIHTKNTKKTRSHEQQQIKRIPMNKNKYKSRPKKKKINNDKKQYIKKDTDNKTGHLT